MSDRGITKARFANAYAAGVCAGYMSALRAAGVDPVQAEASTWEVSDALKRLGGPALFEIALESTDPKSAAGPTGHAVRIPMGDES